MSDANLTIKGLVVFVLLSSISVSIVDGGVHRDGVHHGLVLFVLRVVLSVPLNRSSCWTEGAGMR